MGVPVAFCKAIRLLKLFKHQHPAEKSAEHWARMYPAVIPDYGDMNFVEQRDVRERLRERVRRRRRKSSLPATWVERSGYSPKGCRFESCLRSQPKSPFRFCILRATPVHRSNSLSMSGQLPGCRQHARNSAPRIGASQFPSVPKPQKTERDLKLDAARQRRQVKLRQAVNDQLGLDDV